MNEERFTGKADLYEKYRPSYPRKLIDWLYDNTRAEFVADVGAGTGKFTQCLAAKPWKITAVEPNDDMRSKFNVAGVNAVKGTAENTGLDDNSVDLVTVAQAFHWFDKALFKSECQRILKRGGGLAIVCNERKESGYWEDRNKIFTKYCGACNASAVGGSKESFEEVFDGGYFSEYVKFKTENNCGLDLDGFIGRELSSSYALKEDAPNYSDFKEALEQLFNKYQKDGLIAVKGNSVCYLGKF
ncbi:MAG: class I SAM-dependent methyltransferase [Bacteroides sp.]|nr:class I SAM-dependent methyltransferase [Bacteroides sp.]